MIILSTQILQGSVVCNAFRWVGNFWDGYIWWQWKNFESQL